MLNKEDDKPKIDPVKAGVLKEVPAPVQNQAVKKIQEWKTGDKIILTDVDGYLFNELNDKFKNDKSDRGFRFEYDQLNKKLIVMDDN
tara:strand:+ start:239 stop:499 length:261 start_codon:yes stop_codon:yes gene_type:complete